MKFLKVKFSNILFLVVIILLIVPTTRKPIQVFIHKGLALISPSKVEESDQKTLSNYNWNLQGSDAAIYNFNKAKGHVVFINFWATWCPPCIAEMQSINQLYKDYSKDVVFLLVTSENEKKVSNFILKNNYDFNFYMPLSEEPDLLDTSSIPQTYVIDKSGNIVIEKNGAANWNSESVRNLLDDLLKKE